MPFLFIYFFACQSIQFQFLVVSLEKMSKGVKNWRMVSAAVVVVPAAKQGSSIVAKTLFSSFSSFVFCRHISPGGGKCNAITIYRTINAESMCRRRTVFLTFCDHLAPSAPLSTISVRVCMCVCVCWCLILLVAAGDHTDTVFIQQSAMEMFYLAFEHAILYLPFHHCFQLTHMLSDKTPLAMCVYVLHKQQFIIMVAIYCLCKHWVPLRIATGERAPAATTASTVMVEKVKVNMKLLGMAARLSNLFCGFSSYFWQYSDIHFSWHSWVY